jgi:2-dehydro-3-deoxygluconokinase
VSKVVCFGEIMLRLSPPGYTRFIQTDSFDAVYGGGEANVSVSLANFGIGSTFVTKVPENPIGQAAINQLRKYGVNTKFVSRGGERLGIYYLEKGASQRPSKVVYDRKHSSISQADRNDFDWEEIFEGCNWFHFTGITPALGDNLANILIDACDVANKKGLAISCDLNYRKNLWTTSKAGEIMGNIMQYVDVCIANEEDAEKVFGIKASDTDIENGKLSHEGYKDVAKKLVDKFDFKAVAITLRGSISASDNNWAAMFYDKNEFYFSKNYPIHIIDRVGGGDSFAGGLIYAMLNGYSKQDVIEFAVATSCLKHTIEGDFNHATLDEVNTLMNGDGSGRVQR